MIFGMKKFGRQILMSEDGGAEGGSFMGGSDGGSEGGSTDGGGDTGGSEGGADGDIKYKYPEGLDPSYHGNATLLKYATKEGNFNQADIMKSLIHATSQMGADKMIVPNKNFTDEQWRETFTKLGLPSTLDEYKVDPNLPEGKQLDETLLNGYREKAHQLGILPNQAQGIMEFFNEYTSGQEQNLDTSYGERVAADREALKKEWGEQHGKNLVLAEEALKHFYPSEEERKAVIDTGFLDTLQGTKLFHRLAAALGEDTLDTGNVKFGQSPEQVDAAIATSYNELSTMGRQHPQYASKLKEYQHLLSKKHGSNPVDAGSAARF